MYTQFFKLKEKPFKLTPKPSVFHDNSGITPAYQSLINGILSNEKLILLTGDTGTGKTLCAQRLLADFEQNPEYCCFAIPFTSLPFEEILGYICAELNLTFGLGQNDDKLEILDTFLTHGAGPIRSVVIVIDEAQNLANGIFDGLVKLLEMGEKAKRDIQIVVMARNESDLNLSHPHMAAFSRSISLRCQLQPLTPAETPSYIRYQLEAAGANYSDIFSEQAAARIYDLTQGRARPVNVLCDQTLGVAASEKETIITVDHVDSAYRQQKFDDTIEMQTSQISDAIARFANEREHDSVSKPIPISAHPELQEPETIEPIINESMIVTEEPAQIIPEIQTSPSHAEDKVTEQQPIHELPVHESNNSFFKVALSSLAILSIAGFIFYQIQQQKVILDLEKEITDLKGNVSSSETVATTVEVVELSPDTEQVVIETVAQETGSDNTESSIEPVPENETVYLANQNQQPLDQNSDTAIQKSPLSEDNGVKQIITPVKKEVIKETSTASDNAEILVNQPIAEETPTSAISQLFSIAEYQISELQLTEPEGDNALESYQQILEIEPENEQAKEKIISIKGMFISWAENNIGSNKLDRARRYYQKALLIDPEDLEIPQKLTELDDQIKEQESGEIKTGLLGLAKEGNTRNIKTLLEKGAYPDIQDQRGNTPLMLATDRGHLDAVLALLANGADPNLKNKAGDTALINAVWNNQVKIADQLMRKKANINTTNNRGWTALMYAAIHGHIKLFQKLIKNGADLESRTDDQKTPLSVAAHNGQREIVSLLLQNGARVHAVDKDGWTPLMHAVWNNHATVVQILLLNDSEINFKNKDGWTPLMLAAWNGYESIVEMLLKRGADKSITNNEGVLAFDLASDQRHYSIVALLR